MTFEGISISMEVSKNKPTSNFRANGPKQHKKKSRSKGKGKSKKRPWTE